MLQILLVGSLVALKYGVFGNNVYCKSVDVPDYYWREYNGVIPYDAVRGGTDKAGQPTYIGQAIINKIGSIPASIYVGNRTAVASSAQVFFLTDNTKILCSASPQKFKWIPTDVENMNLITNCKIISGGLDYEDAVYIARVQYDGEVILGKVIRKWNAILIPDKDKETLLKRFELLVFDCKDKEEL